MSTTPNRRFPPLRSWIWAAVWSTVFAWLYLGMRKADTCFDVINGREYIWTTTGVTWIWLYLFFLFANRGRLILLGCSIFVVLAMSHIERAPTAVLEAGAVVELRSMAQAVEAFKREHPQQGIRLFYQRRLLTPSRNYTKLNTRHRERKPMAQSIFF